MTNKKFIALGDTEFSTSAHASDVGLTQEEYDRLIRLLGRTPNKVELGIIGALWSEHCSYKSTKAHLSKFPTTGAHVIVGPGENAGAVSIDENHAVVFKVESHNHPSFIEPFQGAATGVGGILRDIFTMGARPFAAMNLLRFGEKHNLKTQYLLDRVVGGIAHYGNCFGVATVLSNLNFHKSYNKNNLVNAFAIGVAKKEELFLGHAAGIGNRVLYAGAKTGRDGIMGAVMASDNFSDNENNLLPTVQVGDPFKQKLLLEACLACFEKKLIIGIQDMGAAGLSSSSFEMASRASTGLNLKLDCVPLRDSTLSAYEIMLSESQERMLMVVEPDKAAAVTDIFTKYELDCIDIGEVTGDGNVKICYFDDLVASLPAELIVENAPRYRREYDSPDIKNNANLIKNQIKLSLAHVIDRFVDDLGQKSNTYVTEQFDHHIGLQTRIGPGEADCAVMGVPGTNKEVTLWLAAHERLLFIDSFEGARRSLFLGYLFSSCQGAHPIGITNCLNFGSPENKAVMGSLKYAIDGLADGARAIDTPVISGNVSLYNQTEGHSILPTLAIGLVGAREKSDNYIKYSHIKSGEHIILVGDNPQDYAGSEACLGHIYQEKNLIPWSAKRIKLLASCARALKNNNLCSYMGCLDQGGLFCRLITLMAKANLGMNIDFGAKWLEQEIMLMLFSEDTPRLLIVVPQSQLEDIYERCAQKFMLHNLGVINNSKFIISHCDKILLDKPKEFFNKLYDTQLGEFCAQ